MSCTEITLKNNENRVLEYTDFSDLKIELSEGSNLFLKLANFKDNADIKIYGKVGKIRIFSTGLSICFQR